MFCRFCGNQLPDDSQFCDRCGKACGQSTQQTLPPSYNADNNPHPGYNANFGCNANFSYNPNPGYTGNFAPPPQKPGYGAYNDAQYLVNTFSSRLKTNGIIWIVIGALQILSGLFLLEFGSWWLLIVGVLNLVSAIRDLNFAQTVMYNPTGILNYARPLVGPIITLIYNLIFGGIIGVAGSIYYLVGVRGFVMQNEMRFWELENQAVSSNQHTEQAPNTVKSETCPGCGAKLDKTQSTCPQCGRWVGLR